MGFLKKMYLATKQRQKELQEKAKGQPVEKTILGQANGLLSLKTDIEKEKKKQLIKTTNNVGIINLG